MSARGAAVTPRQIRKAFGADAAAGWAEMRLAVRGLTNLTDAQARTLLAQQEQIAKLQITTQHHLDRIKALEAVGTRQAESFRARLRFFVFGR